MPIFNLTPHDIVIIDEHTGGMLATLHSDGIARCACKRTEKPTIEGIPILKLRYGEVEGLPDPVKGVYFIVSPLVKEMCPDRYDLLIPYGVILELPTGQRIRAAKCKDKNGAVVIGCCGLCK